MIHAYLDRSRTYKTLGKGLETIAEKCSETERRAESIETMADMIYATKFMQGKIGESFIGKVSGVSEWAIFVELDNGIEVTVLLPYGQYSINPTEGILSR